MNRWVLFGVMHFAFYAVLLYAPTSGTGMPNIGGAITGMVFGACVAVAAWKDEAK